MLLAFRLLKLDYALRHNTYTIFAFGLLAATTAYTCLQALFNTTHRLSPPSRHISQAISATFRLGRRLLMKTLFSFTR